MSKRKHKCILFFIGSYVLTVFCLSLHFIHKSYYYGFNESEVVFIHGNSYKVIHHKPKLRWCQQLKYITNTTGRPMIALVSFPGSGNTWLRYLLQQATGILTGSIYKDYGLLWNGLYGESITNASVSVVKTHEWGETSRDTFDKALLLIRSPGSAIHAEFNRRSGGHLGYASIDRYIRDEGREWTHFVLEKLKTWRNLNLDWIRNYEKPMLVIRYEDLVQDTKRVIESIIPFLGLTINNSHVRCMMRRKEGIYRRRKPYFPFDPFTSELKIALSEGRKEIDDALEERCDRKKECSRFEMLVREKLLE